MATSRWRTPFVKQCFVTAGVSIHYAQFTLVGGFTAILLPQLRGPDSIIHTDDDSESWIAAIPGLALIFGSFTIPTIMAKYGRKPAILLCIILMIISWITIAAAKNIIWFMMARFLQGFSIGMTNALAPVMVGEYTSPNNRGIFLTTMSFALAIGVLIVHALGSYLTWQVTAVTCAIITFVDLLIAIYLPETPSWLADQSRYEECRIVFRWLRRDDEEDELNKMIEASEIIKESKADVNEPETFGKKTKKNLAYLFSSIRKKEFYMPIFIMIHVYAIGNWAGINVFTSYMLDMIDNIAGKEINVRMLELSIDTQRILFCALTVYIIQKVNRRTMILSTTALCMVALLTIAAYTYAKAKNILPFDHPAIGVGLVHVHMFTLAIGSSSWPVIISGEIYPLEFRSLCSGIGCFFYSLCFFISLKTFSYIIRTLGFYGAYCVYAGIIGYSVMIVWFFLPETKDRTLQDIEADFTGRPLSPEEQRYTQSLTSSKS